MKAGDNEMNFSDLLKLKKIDPTSIKIHLAKTRPNKFEPWNELTEGRFEDWQRRQNSHNFSRPLILSFVFIREKEWLFAGIHTVNGYEKRDGRYHYSTTQATDYEEYIGRMVIRFDEKNFRASYVKAEKYIDKLEIVQIFQEKYVCDPFPGYSKVCISHDTLKRIFETEESSWKTALSAVFGIYLITDSRNGRHYVGKADGIEGIWQRWGTYSENGHGGNHELNKILQEKGLSYAENFQYSILEVIINDNQSVVDAREQHWKKVLCSQNFGYNRN